MIKTYSRKYLTLFRVTVVYIYTKLINIQKLTAICNKIWVNQYIKNIKYIDIYER